MMFGRFVSRLSLPLTLLAIGSSFSTPAAAQFDCTYQGGNDVWSNAAAWNTNCNGTFPNNSGSDTYNASVNTGSVDVDQAISIQDLSLTNGSIGGTDQLTVTGIATFSAGDLVDDVVVRAEGGLQISGTATKQLFNSASLVNASGSTAEWSEGGVQLVTATTSIVNENSGTFNITGASRSMFSSGFFDNQGDVIVNLSAVDQTLSVAPTFDNDGSIDVQNGELSLNGGGMSAGSFTGSADGVIAFGGGNHELAAGSNVNGANVAFNGGAIEVDGSYNAADTTVGFGNVNLNVTATTQTLNMTNGNLGGSGQLTVSGLTTFAAGDLADDIVVRAEGGLQIDGTATKQLFNNASLVNVSGSTADWSEGGIQLVNTGTSIVNESSASFNITGASRSMFSSGLFDNQGSVVVNLSAADQSISVQPVFDNDGSIDVQNGELSLNGGGMSNGSFTSGANGVIAFGGGNHELTASSNVNGANVAFNGGAIEVDGTYNAADTTIGFGNVNLNVSANTQALNVTNGTLGGSGQMTVSGLTSFTSGDLADDVVVRAEGGLQIDGSATKQLFNNASLVNVSGATADWSEGSIQLVNTGTSIVNESGATFNITGDGRSMFSSGFFDNQGDVIVNLSAVDQTLSVAPTFDNDGSIDVQNGELSLNGGGTSTGSFTSGENGVIAFGGGNHELAAASNVNGANVAFNGGTIEVNGTYNAADTSIGFGTANFNVAATTDTLSLSNGTLGGSGQLTASGLTTFVSGDLSDDMIFRAEGGLAINSTSTKQLFDNASLVNASGSTADWSEGSLQLVNVGSSIVNENGATFNITGETRSMFGSGTFDNQGEVVVNLSDADQSLGVVPTLQNDGTITVQQGELRVSSTSGTGDWAADGGDISVTNAATGPDFVTSGSVSADNGSVLNLATSSTANVGELVIGETGTLELSNFSTLDVAGNFVLLGTDESQMTIDPTSSLIMSGGVGAEEGDWGDWGFLEIGGFDLGTDPANNVGDPDGFIENFSLAELVIGADSHIFLTDEIDNGNRGGPQGNAEALYVDTLIFSDELGELNLNGLNLYFNNLVGDASQIINVPVPVPPAVFLFLSALGLLGWVRRRGH